MRKITVNFVLFISLMIILVGCSPETKPINVVFKNQTLLGSENYCITTVYQEDKRVREFYTDIYIQTDVAPTTIVVNRELGEKWEFIVPSANEWHSLTNLIDQNLSLATFARAETTTYIFNFKDKLNFKLKAVGGELVYHLNSGKSTLQNIFNASSEFKVKIDKTI